MSSAAKKRELLLQQLETPTADENDTDDEYDVSDDEYDESGGDFDDVSEFNIKQLGVPGVRRHLPRGRSRRRTGRAPTGDR